MLDLTGATSLLVNATGVRCCWRGRVRLAGVVSALLVAATAYALGPSEMSPSSPVPARTSKPVSLTVASASDTWNNLTSDQRVSLKPLESNWNKLSDAQKRKWISLSASYRQMTVSQQVKLHERMAQWAALSPRQREQARLNFAETQKIAPRQKSEKWQAYQSLSMEEKNKLAKTAPPKPPRTALAAKPASSGQLSRVSGSKKSALIASPASAGLVLDKNTLLSRPSKPVAPTRRAPLVPAMPVSAGQPQ